MKSGCGLGDEVGDLLFTFAAFANAAGIDLEKCVSATLEKYGPRDAQDWQKVKAKA